ncbi:MAG TPA: protein kinase [Thermoanaerobaculia bacterium]|nr:protein kinase [Thermoanaerobaculia bacterium]
MSLDPGTSLGSYEVLGPLGAGGMGEVYRAYDRKLGREVAIKILPEAFAQDAAKLTRFDREARMLAAVNHPNLAAIYGLEEAGPIRYIVMELVPGQTLSQILVRGPMPPREALGAARQIAEGLEAAHEKGIVHRDLKPANIKITPEGRVKVLDLGLAKAMDPKAEDSRDSSESPTLRLDDTRPGVIVGTVEFMSPEQARGRAVDKRTDVWSFGCVLFEMLSGRRAFTGESPADVLINVATKEPEWSALPVATPVRVRELLERCLQKDPNRRLRDIGDARIALEDAYVASGDRSGGAMAPLPSPRERRLVLAILAGLGLAAGLWLAYRPRTMAPASPEAPRLLAVLPFRDLSGRPDGQRIGEGLVETVSARLSNLSGVQVVTPSVVVEAADRQRDPFRVARDLGADYVLVGATQQEGDRLRFTWSVWQTRERRQVGGGEVTGTASNIFAIQDQLTDHVARELHATPAGRRTPLPAGLVTTSQQERYLQALGYLQRYDRKASVEAALAILNPLASEVPGSALVQSALARACLHEYTLTRDKDWANRAIEAAERATRLDPGIPDVHVARGLVLSRTGKGAEAVSEFQIALSQAPDSLDGLLGLAEAYQSVGRNDEAEGCYKRAVALQPGSWVPYNHYGVFDYSIGRYPQAAEMFRRVVAKTPDNVRAWNNLGAACEQADRFDDALEAFQKSAAIAPSDGAYSNLGTLQFFLGRYADSAGSFEKATALTPGKSLYWANLGDAYRWAPGDRPKAAGAYAKAIALARQELEVDPRDARALCTLGLALAKTGKAAEGLAAIRKALEIEPGNPDSFYDAAVVSNLLGKTDDAVGWIQQAVEAGLGLGTIEREPEFATLRKTPAYKTRITAKKDAA